MSKNELNAEQKILVAARQLFYKKGYDGTKMRDIANLAEVNLAMLHYYYRHKETIFMIVFDEAFDVLFKKIHIALSVESDFFERIRLLVYSYVDMAMENPDLPMFVMSEANKNPMLIFKILTKHKEKNLTSVDLSTFEREVNNAIKDKLIKSIDPRLFFMDILSLTFFPCMSTNMLGPMFKDQEDFKQLLQDRREHITETLINAIKL